MRRDKIFGQLSVFWIIENQPHGNIPVSECLCTVCDSGIENEENFLLIVLTRDKEIL